MSTHNDDHEVQEDIDEGFVVIYVTKLNLKLKKDDNPENQKIQYETVFKIYVKQNNDELESVLFELSDDKRLDFLFRSVYDKEKFENLKEEQNLEIEFDDFPNVIRQVITVINKQDPDDKSEGKYKVSFKSEESQEQEGDEEEEESFDSRYLIISQYLEFCPVEIFKLTFERCSEDIVQRISQSRYDEISQKLKAVQTEYKDIIKRLQRQAPKIYADLKKQEEQKELDE